MAEEVVSKCRAKPGPELGAEVLGVGSADPADHAHDHEDGGAGHDVRPVATGDAVVDDACHHEGHEELEGGLEELKERSENAFPPITGKISDELEHGTARNRGVRSFDDSADGMRRPVPAFG